MTSAPLATLACGGAPAVPRPGVASSVSTSITSLAAAIGAAIAGVPGEILLTIIANQQFNVAAMCAAGDPGDIEITPQDLLDASLDTFAPAGIAATQKIKQWFTHLIFPTWCQCSDGTQPPPPAVSAPPPESTNPNMPPGGLTGPCWDIHQVVAYPPATDNATARDVTALYLPGLPQQGMYGGVVGHHVASPVAAGTTGFGHVGSASFIGDVAGGATVTVDYFDANKAFILEQNLMSGTTSYDGFHQTPSNAAYWGMYVLNWNGSGSYATDVQISVHCTGRPANAIDTPCCPPDPSLDARLTYLTNLVVQIAGMLQPASDELVDGKAHGPFSGTGSVLLEAECAAVRVDVLSDLATWPKNPGTPDYFWSLGFITSYAEANPLKGWRLVYSSQTFPLQPYTDMIGWTLPSGVQIRITEQLGASAAG